MKNSKAGLIIAIASALVTVFGAAGGYYFGRMMNGTSSRSAQESQVETAQEAETTLEAAVESALQTK